MIIRSQWNSTWVIASKIFGRRRILKWSGWPWLGLIGWHNIPAPPDRWNRQRLRFDTLNSKRKRRLPGLQTRECKKKGLQLVLDACREKPKAFASGFRRLHIQEKGFDVCKSKKKNTGDRVLMLVSLKKQLASGIWRLYIQTYPRLLGFNACKSRKQRIMPDAWQSQKKRVRQDFDACLSNEVIHLQFCRKTFILQFRCWFE